MLLKRELPFDEVPRLWEACWCAQTGLAPIPVADPQHGDGDKDGAADASGTGRAANARAVSVGEDFLLYCCAAILQRKQKEMIKSGNSLEDFFHCIRGVQSHALKLVEEVAAAKRRTDGVEDDCTLVAIASLSKTHGNMGNFDMLSCIGTSDNLFVLLDFSVLNTDVRCSKCGACDKKSIFYREKKCSTFGSLFLFFIFC